MRCEICDRPTAKAKATDALCTLCAAVVAFYVGDVVDAA